MSVQRNLTVLYCYIHVCILAATVTAGGVADRGQGGESVI